MKLFYEQSKQATLHAWLSFYFLPTLSLAFNVKTSPHAPQGTIVHEPARELTENFHGNNHVTENPLPPPPNF
ncbi:hypothetical protein BTV66_06270 [Pasteurella multocida subsp. septica]|nr:hypothetical protein BTV66_06270 [Pasteurella multocida subsp. septica]